MRDVVARAGLQGEWHVESAGIEDWHSGHRPDERALNVLARHNIEYNGKARVLAPEDFLEFDYIFAMDLSNLAALRRMAPKGTTAKLLILGNFGLKPDERIIEDPYYVSRDMYYIFRFKKFVHLEKGKFNFSYIIKYKYGYLTHFI